MSVFSRQCCQAGLPTASALAGLLENMLSEKPKVFELDSVNICLLYPGMHTIYQPLTLWEVQQALYKYPIACSGTYDSHLLLSHSDEA